MDCSNNKGKTLPCRVQMQMPPCMDTNCSCGVGTEPLRPMHPGMAVYMDRDPEMPCRSNHARNAGMPQQGCRGSVMPMISLDEMREPRKAVEFQISQMPVGMAYVPWQKWCQTYPIEQGFQRGTIFPELDLPFTMGRCRG